MPASFDDIEIAAAGLEQAFLELTGDDAEAHSSASSPMGPAGDAGQTGRNGQAEAGR